MTESIKNIPEYKTAQSSTGFGWIAVQKWDGSSYAHVCSFRAMDSANQFIQHELNRRKDNALFQ